MFFIAGMFLFEFVIFALTSQKEMTDNQTGTYGKILLIRVIFLIAIGLYSKLVKKENFSLPGFTMSAYKKGVHYGVIVSLAFLALVIATELSYYLVFSKDLAKLLFTPPQQMKTVFSNTTFILLYTLTVGVIAPLAEEVIFRGVLYDILRNKISAIPATALNVFIFTSLHSAPLIALTIPAIGGIVFCILYEKTGSVIAPLIVHASANSAIILLNVFYS